MALPKLSCVLLSLAATALAAPKGVAPATAGGYTRALAAYSKTYGRAKPGTFYYRDDKFKQSCFKELARIYTEDTAVGMVEAVPGALSFDPANFQPTLDVFAEKFGGDDAARAMIVRNPALLGTTPKAAAKADGAVMTASYVIAATRPIGGLLLVGLFLLLGSGSTHN